MDEPPFDVPGGWRCRAIELLGRAFDILLPADPDSVLEARLAAEQCGRVDANAASDPYWAALWSSASPTAEAVLETSWESGESVLELGCGMGLVGLAALARGLQVTFSDHMEQAIQLALYNARRNGFQHARGLRLDWHQPPHVAPAERYSAILGSDILYNRGNHGPILKTLGHLLAPHGVCWIGDPGRFNSREFLQVASKRFRVQLRDRDGNTLFVPQSGQYQMFVLHR